MARQTRKRQYKTPVKAAGGGAVGKAEKKNLRIPVAKVKEETFRTPERTGQEITAALAASALRGRRRPGTRGGSGVSIDEYGTPPRAQDALEDLILESLDEEGQRGQRQQRQARRQLALEAAAAATRSPHFVGGRETAAAADSAMSPLDRRGVRIRRSPTGIPMPIRDMSESVFFPGESMGERGPSARAETVPVSGRGQLAREEERRPLAITNGNGQLAVERQRRPIVVQGPDVPMPAREGPTFEYIGESFGSSPAPVPRVGMTRGQLARGAAGAALGAAAIYGLSKLLENRRESREDRDRDRDEDRRGPRKPIYKTAPLRGKFEKGGIVKKRNVKKAVKKAVRKAAGKR